MFLLYFQIYQPRYLVGKRGIVLSFIKFKCLFYKIRKLVSMSEYDNDAVNAQEVDEGASTPVNQAVVIWGLAAIAFSILFITFNNAPMVLGAGFFAKFFAVIAGSILGLIGALAGDALRKLARPSSVYTRGGFFELIWIKVFWAIGPQVIGMFIGVALGVSQVLSW